MLSKLTSLLISVAMPMIMLVVLAMLALSFGKFWTAAWHGDESFDCEGMLRQSEMADMPDGSVRITVPSAYFEGKI